MIRTNNIPDQQIGTFRNQDVSALDNVYAIIAIPEDTGSLISLEGDSGLEYIFGVLLNGIELDSIAVEPWPHSEEGVMDENVNRDWNLEALKAPIGLDCNYAQVQPTGKYHCYGSPVLYDLIANAIGEEMKQVGWAADGFPIHYKYAYTDAMDNNSAVVEMTSSYELLTDNRSGGVVTTSCSEYNGADYAFIEGKVLLIKQTAEER